MLNKTFTLASAVSLMGAVVWVASTTACGGEEEATPGSSTSSSGDGGSTSGSTSSGNSSSGGTTSSSGASSSSSGLVDPSTVDGVEIPFTKCEAFTKCNGDIAGSWKVVGGCLADDTFDEFRDLCKGLKEHDVVIKAKGTVVADDKNVKQDTSIFLSAALDFPKTCAQPPFAPEGCKSIPALLSGPFAPPGKKFDHMVCQEEGDLCKCKGDVMIVDKTEDTYKTDGTGVLTTTSSAKDERTYEYCPANGNITYRETTTGNKTFGMFVKIGP